MPSNRPLSKRMLGIVAISMTAIALRCVVRMNYWLDHRNPIFALSNAFTALVTGLIAMTYVVALLPSVSSQDSWLTRLVSRDSPVLPTTVGLILAAVGAYGMLDLVTQENFYFDWTFFGLVLAAGIYVLRRTFAVGE